jgi:hypothetical protein
VIRYLICRGHGTPKGSYGGQDQLKDLADVGETWFVPHS